VDVTGGLRLRHAQSTDYLRVLAVMDSWWGGRHMSARLSHVFFSHFESTSFVIETETELMGFLLVEGQGGAATPPAGVSTVSRARVL